MGIDFENLTSSANTETIVAALKELKESINRMEDKYADYENRTTVLENK